MIRIYRDHQRACISPQGSVVAIGAFDGMHLGHQTLLRQVAQHAQTSALAAAVVSFEPLPRAFFGRNPLPRLASVREKISLLDDAGMDIGLLLRFNHALTQMSATDFVEKILLKTLAVRAIYVGEDFHFGHKRQGDIALLRRMGATAGFAVCPLQPVIMHGERVSSSAIRHYLEHSDFARAEALLGRPFSISGRVGHGQQLGRTLGYPTANIMLGGRTVPIAGVFAVRVTVDDDARVYDGVASLGTRPTVNQVNAPLLEVYLFDFEGDLYTRRMRVTFVAKLRAEEKFDNLDALVAQMDDDAMAARQILD